MARSDTERRASREPASPRRVPKQRRSREIVEAIVEAGLRLLEEQGAAALTTNRIAERAGVSIGSLYRYFPNRAAVLAAIYERDAAREVEELGLRGWPVAELPLEEALRALVDYQIERHRRLLEMEGDFYRDHHGRFSLSERIGSREVVARIRAVLASHRERVRPRSLDDAAFLLARGTSAMVRLALEECPARLSGSAFREELVELVLRYVLADPPGTPRSSSG